MDEAKKKEMLENLNMAESMVGASKAVLRDYWDDYIEVQEWFGMAEDLRLRTEYLKSRVINGTLE